MFKGKGEGGGGGGTQINSNKQINFGQKLEYTSEYFQPLGGNVSRTSTGSRQKLKKKKKKKNCTPDGY